MSNSARSGLSFPQGFVWGAATAAYQVEGAATEDGRGESIWDRFSHTPGKTHNGDTGDVAIDHYHLWKSDLEIMSELGLNAYRFSLAWPRIIPTGRGQINEKGLDFYDRLTDGLLERGISPWPTLYHWDLPQVLEDAGGWRNRATVDAFADYVDAITRRLGDRVKNWITVNEPWVAGFLGHLMGIHAPGLRNLGAALSASHHLLLAHGRAMDVIRSNVPDSKAGITLNLTMVYPNGDSAADAEVAHQMDGQVNRWFLDPVFRGQYPEDMVRGFDAAMPKIEAEDFSIISRPTDFLGINYYSPFHVEHDPGSPMQMRMVEQEGEKTSVGWLVDPPSLEKLLVRVHDEYAPAEMYITENGAAFNDAPPVDGRVQDERRTVYLHDHLLASLKSLDEDVPLRGYFVWSLFDNYEWSEGYAKRFGITYVDYATMERTLKDSARWYAEVTRANAVLPVRD
ncbi:MAG: GH1 family beta-glucosidase [Thermomicrobiales bacterium]